MGTPQTRETVTAERERAEGPLTAFGVDDSLRGVKSVLSGLGGSGAVNRTGGFEEQSDEVPRLELDAVCRAAEQAQQQKSPPVDDDHVEAHIGLERVEGDTQKRVPHVVVGGGEHFAARVKETHEIGEVGDLAGEGGGAHSHHARPLRREPIRDCVEEEALEVLRVDELLLAPVPLLSLLEHGLSRCVEWVDQELEGDGRGQPLDDFFHSVAVAAERDHRRC